ncbi:hypothetical protein [Brachyspira sp.]|uniref:hypothetical protein n=1 Tax=Brachyspira sp. TaxID=1977261 RepID=UPI003D7E0CCF
MKKIIFLFLIFSAIVFAEWQYSIVPNDNGVNFHRFTVFDYESNSAMTVDITYKERFSNAGIIIFNDDVKENDKLDLYLLDNSGDYISYSVFDKDIKDGFIVIENLDGNGRGTSLIKLLVSSQSVVLYNKNTAEILATFNLKGLKQILKKKIGNSYWYKYELND